MVLGHGSKGLEAVSVIDDMPAYKAGIKSGDHIVSIDGVDTNSMTIEDAASKIRGEAGSDVTIVVERDNQLLTFNVTREEIVLPTVKSKMLSDHIGYIRISQFAEHTAGDFKTQYEQLLSEGMTSLVLDLRDNPGGLLNSAQDIASIIMPEGTLVSFTTRDGKIKNYVSAFKNNICPLATIATAWSAIRNIFLSTETRHTVSAITRFYKYTSAIYKHNYILFCKTILIVLLPFEFEYLTYH